MAFGAVLSTLTVLANAALMATAGWFLASMAFAGLVGVPMNYLLPAAMIRFYALIRITGRYFERLITHDATLRFLTSLRVWFYEQVEPLAPGPLDRYRTGDLLSRLGRDIDALDNLYLRISVPVAVAIIGAGIITAVMESYGTLPALWLLLCLIVGGVGLPLWGLQRGRTPEYLTQTSKATLRAITADYILNCEDLLMAGAEEKETDLILAEQERLLQAQDVAHRTNTVLESAILLLTNMAAFGVLILSIPLLQRAHITGPDLPLMVLLALASFETVGGLPSAFLALGDTVSAAQRIISITQGAPEIPEPVSPRAIPSDPILTFSHTSLRYPDTAKPALDDISLYLTRARRVAVVGPSGAGKSSLVALALRLRAPTSGSVLLSGYPIANYAGSHVRALMSGVLQTHHVFNGTIAENLRIACPKATQTQLDHACLVAGLTDEIALMPKHFDTNVGELGMALSGGQRRRLAVAQALLRAPQFLILDEPTEGLDPHMAQALISRILMDDPKRGILLITHRTEGLELMDEILVVEAGHIVETGTADSLRKRNGRFSAFCDRVLTEQAI